MRILKNRILPVVLWAVVVVGGVDLTAYAAHGHPAVLGHSHAESRAATRAGGGSVTVYTYSLPQVADSRHFSMTFPNLPKGRRYLASYWVQGDMTVSTDGLLCELADRKLSGTPGERDYAVSRGRRDFESTAGGSGYVTTSNRSVTLDCGTDSDTATIASVPSGQVMFLPVGKAHVKRAVLAP